MPTRVDRVHRLAALVGSSVLEVEDTRSGWPTLAAIHLAGESLPLALFVGTVGRSHRNRDDVERRFQNPVNRPLIGVAGRASVLLGLWDSDDLLDVPRPVIVTADAAQREGRLTRWPVFVPVSALTDAASTGWSAHLSESGELIHCMLPTLLPAAVAADLNGVDPTEHLVRTAIEASGLLDELETNPEGPAAARARRAAWTLVRDSTFSRRVLDAYAQRCAMCGLGLTLVQAAHIYPASAPGSQDEPWNGLALCANHHLAFDRHFLAVRPETREVIFRGDVLEQATTDPVLRAFVEGTLPVLRIAVGGDAAEPSMFARRYAHYGDSYGWLDADEHAGPPVS